MYEKGYRARVRAQIKLNSKCKDMLVDHSKKDIKWAKSEAQQERIGLGNDADSDQVIYLCLGEIPCKLHIHALYY